MRYYAITKNGITRIMCTLVDPMKAIAKWHPDDQAQVTKIREIKKEDIPKDTSKKDLWEDTGSEIQVKK